MSPKFPFLICCVLGFAPIPSEGVVTMIDDFEINEGHFTSAPSTSGSTAGETETAPNVGPSTADWDATVGQASTASQRIFLDDDPAIPVTDLGTSVAWRLRHLSGGGTPANNVSLVNNATSHVGYWMLTSSPNLEAGIMLDDGAALERAAVIPVIADGQWHLYQWQLSDATQWEPFAGSGPNGAIDAATATIDSIFVRSLLGTGDQDAVFSIDNVSFNDAGPLPVPEPSTLFLAAASLTGVLVRRRRRPIA
ncbi:MAG: PEP-CTERM sorting domain-containing protein [Verrucomicrobiales bacterium]